MINKIGSLDFASLLTGGHTGDQQSGGGATTTFGLAASRFQLPTAIADVPSPYTSRRMHYATSYGDVSDLIFVDVDWSMHNTDANAYTIKKFVEYPEGVFTQVTWDGQPTLALEHGMTYSSDPVPVTIPAGAKFWERTVHITGVNKSVPLIELPYSSQTLGVDDGNASSDRGNVNIIVASGNTTTMGSVACYGTVAARNAPSFLLLGDSIAFGQADGGIGVYGGSGWIANLLDRYGIPYMKMAKGGGMAADLVSSGVYQQPLIETLPFSHAIVEYGVNDITNGRTMEELLADHQTIYSWIVQNPNLRALIQTTLSPRSSSTDGWATVENQTVKTDGNMAQHTEINEAIRAVPVNVDFVLDAADAFMTDRNSGLWETPPVPTPDGTHPNHVGVESIAGKLELAIEDILNGNQPEPLFAPVVAFSWPDESSTGPVSGVALTDWTGDTTNIAPGTYSNTRFTSAIALDAGDYVFENCEIDFAAGFFGIDASLADSCDVTNCRIVGPGVNGVANACILSAPVGTIQSCDCSGAENGITLQGTSSAIGNYIHDLNSSKADGHYDGIVAQSDSHDCLIKDNNVFARDTAGIFIQDDGGVVMYNITVEHNRIRHDPVFGGYASPIYMNAKSAPGNITNSRIINNVLEAGNGGSYYATTAGQDPITISGNIDFNSGFWIDGDLGGGPEVRSFVELAYASGHEGSTFAAPTGTADGDILLCGLFVAANGGAPIVTPPVGWTELPNSPQDASDGSGFAGQMHLYSKTASGETGDYTFAHSVANSGGVLVAISGSSGIDVSAAASGVGSDATTPSITTSVANELVVWFSSNWEGPGSAQPRLMFEISDALVYAAANTKTIEGATGNITQDTSNSAGEPWTAFIVSLKPAT